MKHFRFPIKFPYNFKLRIKFNCDNCGHELLSGEIREPTPQHQVKSKAPIPEEEYSCVKCPKKFYFSTYFDDGNCGQIKGLPASHDLVFVEVKADSVNLTPDVAVFIELGENHDSISFDTLRCNHTTVTSCILEIIDYNKRFTYTHLVGNNILFPEPNSWITIKNPARLGIRITEVKNIDSSNREQCSFVLPIGFFRMNN